MRINDAKAGARAVATLQDPVPLNRSVVFAFDNWPGDTQRDMPRRILTLCWFLA